MCFGAYNFFLYGFLFFNIWEIKKFWYCAFTHDAFISILCGYLITWVWPFMFKVLANILLVLAFLKP